ncbi:MAG TPA: YihY family inner membrane protein, partial [Candidatus Hydrogenedentes bacterium]|nr:YihY family inner membrane protein [Candidatus Hydrogenedentota bacterium]
EELWRDLIGLLFPGAQVAGDDDAGPMQLLVRLAERGATNRRALTISGIIYVLSTVLGLMRNVEWSFNRIWGVKHSRNPFRMISDYLVITLLLPFVAALVLGITAALESETLMEGLGPFSVTLRGAQLMVICLTFAILYYMVPNTRVKVRYALLGGLVAGLLWTLVSWGYVKFQFGMARYEVFFSTFALFPLLLMWIYASWLILLFGALLAFAYQNEKTFALEHYSDNASFAYREAVAVRAVIEMTRRFRQGLPALTVAEAGNVWNVPTRLLNDTMEWLVNAGLIARCATEPVSFQPARAPERIRVMDVVRAMRDAGEDPSHLRDDETYRTLFDALNALEPQYLGASIADAADSLGPIPTPETSSGK